MKLEKKTERQLISELEELRQRIGELEKSESECERAEAALRECERKYRDLVDNSIVGIYRTNLAGKILYVNAALARMLEFDSPEEMMSEGVLARYQNHQDRERLLEILKQSGRIDNFEFNLFTRKGETITALLSAVLDQDIISGMIMDISERKRAEEALRESEQRYSSLFKNNHSAMLLIDPESAEIIDANPAASLFYGWSLEELTSKKITDINVLTNEQVFQEMERAKSAQCQHFLFRHRLANDEVRDVEVFSGPIVLHGKRLLYSIIHDISKRKRAEEALRKSEADLLEKSRHLEEVNAALKVLLKRREDDKVELEENLFANVKELILPYFAKLKKSQLEPQQTTLVSILESRIRDIVSPITAKLSSRFLNLTPTEIQIASLIRDGKTNKEIADLLYLSVNTIRSHRFHIRSKLNLKNKKINLRTYLRSLQNE